MVSFNDLNEKQLEAVMATEGFVRVIAGAGSGKTKLLVSRYAYLVLECGIDPANILCVTFTNKAAGEMRRRISAMIGAEHDTSLICTYHSFCARLLRENSEKLFLPKNLQIIDAQQQKSILEEVYQKFELKLDYASFEYMLKKIGEFKSDISYVSKMCNPAPCAICEQDRILEEYLQRQKALYALDFHDLLSYALYLLRTDKQIRERWQTRLNYIQVDEFQDSSRREMELIDILSSAYKNVMIVGDPDQNIYEWRGSDVRLLVDFDKRHESTQTIFLNRNYRSTPQILACANALIDKNEFRLKKDLFTLSPDGAEVVHCHSKNDDDEMSYIVRTVKSIKDEREIGFSDIAILYRSVFLSRLVEKKLAEANIPYEIYGGVKFYLRMEIQDIIAYLRLIVFDDDLAFKRIVNTPRRKIGRVKVKTLEDLQENERTLFSTEARPSLFDTLANHQCDGVFKSSGASQFVSFVKNMRKDLGSMRISELVNKICDGSGYEQYIRELGDEERLDNLAEFKRIASEFEKNLGEDLTAAEFLQQIALQFDTPDDRQGEAVKLMTIHAAKGLEFPVVFVVGFSERIFPSYKTLEERKKLGLEEERRLCYVAITRAKKQLFLMDSEGTTNKGDKKLPSRFLFEIGENNYRRVGEISKALKSESNAFASRTSFNNATSIAAKVDEIVEHHIFGKGKIIAYNEKRESYTIQFDNMNCPRNISKSYFEVKHTQVKPPEHVNLDSQSRKEPPTEDKERPTINADNDEHMPQTIAIVPQSKPVEHTPVENRLVESSPAEHKPAERKPAEAHAPLSENLWKRDDVPHDGWTCTGVTDLGVPAGVCQMCGYQIIRYVHHMTHPNYRSLDVGCICAGKMEGDIEGAKKREKEFKNKQARRESFLKKTWNRSKIGNLYLKIKNHLVILYRQPNSEVWRYAVDGTFCNDEYSTKEDAVAAAFEELEAIK